MEDAGRPEPFTEASREALRLATDRLMESLRLCLRQIPETPGRRADMAVHADDLMVTVERWNGAAVDHRGAAPLRLQPRAQQP